MSTDLLEHKPKLPGRRPLGLAHKQNGLGPSVDPLGPVATKAVARRRAALGALATCVVVLLLFAVRAILQQMDATNQSLILYTVTRSDLPIVVTERGNLESQQRTDIRCEVENLSYDRSGSSGTQILYIVPNGTPVKEGDLLVELDSAPIRDRLDQQILDYERVNAERLQATAKYKNQKTQNTTLLQEAKLKVELAGLELEMYEDDEDGTYQIARKEFKLKIEETKNGIAEAQAALAMQTTDLNGIKTLHKLGYRGRGDLEQAVYKYLQAEDRLVAATNAMEKALSDLKKLETYEHKMQQKTLAGALRTGERNLVQVQRDNESLLAQAEAAMKAAEQSFAKEAEKLEKYKAQLEKCKVYAPHDGMVVYATDGARYGRVIAEGAAVRERQRILRLPDLSRMQVETAVHESVLHQVREGLPVVVRVDAFPEHTYQGTVKSVAVLPDRGGWMNSDIKVYETIVIIDEPVDKLKPGMTAVVEIHVDRIEDVLSVPVQAIVQIDHDNWCYVKTQDGVQRRMLELGQTNDKFVEVVKGLREGEPVVLNPMGIFDEAQKRKDSTAPDKDMPDSQPVIGG